MGSLRSLRAKSQGQKRIRKDKSYEPIDFPEVVNVRLSDYDMDLVLRLCRGCGSVCPCILGSDQVCDKQVDYLESLFNR